MSTEKDLTDLASLIHQTIEIQGVSITYGAQTIEVGCYHSGPGLGICIGLARTILRRYEMVKNEN